MSIANHNNTLNISWPVSLIHETSLTVENYHLCEPPPAGAPHNQFELPSSPSSLSQGFVPPSPPRLNGTDVIGQDSSPPVPFPSLIAQHEVSNLFSDDCFFLEENVSLDRRTNTPEEEGDGEQKRREDLQIPPSQQDKQRIGLTISALVQVPCWSGSPLRWCRLRRCCSRSFCSRRLKMRVGGWLLRVSCFFIWAASSGGKEMHPAGTELHQRSKSQAREHAGPKHQQPYHRNTSHRRKGEPTSSPPAGRGVIKPMN